MKATPRKTLLGPAVAVLLVLAVHAVLTVANLHMDGDALREAWKVSLTGSFGDTLVHRGRHTVLYVAQSPVIWGVTRAGSRLWTAWNPLSATRLLNILAMAGIAWLLWRAAGSAGCGPAGRAAAVLAPFLWHGFSFLVAECDDNVTTDLPRVAFILGLGWRYGAFRGHAPGPASGAAGSAASGSDGLPSAGSAPGSAASGTDPSYGSAPFHLDSLPVLGAVLGMAIAWHFQSVMLVPVLVLVPLLPPNAVSPGRGARDVIPVLVAALLVYSAWLGGSLAAGLLHSVSPAEALRAFTEHHASPAGYWFFSSGRSPSGQAGLLAEGWGRMVMGFRTLRPAGGTAVLVAVAVVTAVTAVAALRALWGTPALKVLGTAVAVHTAHALFYESNSIERWDIPALLSGLVGAMALVRLRRNGSAGQVRRLGLMMAGAAGVLLLCNITAYWRFATLAEGRFIAAARGEGAFEEPPLDCIGAHFALCRTARRMPAIAGPDDGLVDLVRTVPIDSRIEYFLGNWFSIYLYLYAPEMMARKGSGSLAMSLLSPPASPRYRVILDTHIVQVLRQVKQ